MSSTATFRPSSVSFSRTSGDTALRTGSMGRGCPFGFRGLRWPTKRLHDTPTHRTGSRSPRGSRECGPTKRLQDFQTVLGTRHSATDRTGWFSLRVELTGGTTHGEAPRIDGTARLAGRDPARAGHYARGANIAVTRSSSENRGKVPGSKCGQSGASAVSTSMRSA